jgi:hypothetical protein
MRFYDVTFFCEKNQGPVAHLHISKSEDNQKWPITLSINFSEESHDKPSITIHIDSIADLLKFRNSIIFETDVIELYMEEHSNG